MKEIIKKMAQAKSEVKNSPIKKEGRNTFSKYDYFTPAQIERIVSTVCENCGLLPKFDLVRNDLGVFGKLTVYDVESGESIDFEMATAIPSITATNIAQQLGGCVTYTERYLKMTAFGITDNRLDFDTDENTNKTVKGEEKQRTPAEIELDIVLNDIESAKTVDDLTTIYNANVKFQSNKILLNKLSTKKTELLK